MLPRTTGWIRTCETSCCCGSPNQVRAAAARMEKSGIELKCRIALKSIASCYGFRLNEIEAADARVQSAAHHHPARAHQDSSFDRLRLTPPLCAKSSPFATPALTNPVKVIGCVRRTVKTSALIFATR